MDNGKVTSSNGKEADARNCILILTTNLGAVEAEKNNIGFDSPEKEYEDEEMNKYFKPEFRNRLDATITFSKLGKEVMLKIVGKFLVELKQMIVDKNVTMEISDEALDWLVDKGFNKKMGARPLQRLIDKEIKRPLSRELLFGKLVKGGNVKVEVIKDELKVTTAKEVVSEENRD